MSQLTLRVHITAMIWNFSERNFSLDATYLEVQISSTKSRNLICPIANMKPILFTEMATPGKDRNNCFNIDNCSSFMWLIKYQYWSWFPWIFSLHYKCCNILLFTSETSFVPNHFWKHGRKKNILGPIKWMQAENVC